jgi:hypothetical protein
VAATSTEFLRWCQQQVTWWRRGQWDAMRNAPHPAPDADHGLPDGWMAVSTFTASEGIVWCLTRRDAGGWLLVSHDPSTRETALSGAEETLAGLFATLLRARERVGAPREATDWLKGVISAMYDPADPNEAAEQVLFALTDKIRTPPRAAT